MSRLELVRVAPTQKEMKHMAGNAFHSALFGSWAMFILSHVRRRPRNIPLPVMSSEFGTLRSSSSIMPDRLDSMAEDGIEDEDGGLDSQATRARLN